MPVEKCRGVPRKDQGVVLLPDCPSKWMLTKPPDRSLRQIFSVHSRSWM
jgi:hypothetical protein